VLIVNVFVVNHVLKKVYVQIVNRKGRMKMEKNKSQESKKQELKASLKTVRKSSSQAERNEKRRVALRFSPTAWAKLLYFRDKSDNEVGGFGITDPDDLLLVKEFVTIKQEVTVVSVKFDDEAVANFFEDQVDLGRKPEQFARIWLHSHPGNSPEPSIIDDDTFARVFGNCEWAVLFVVAQDNKTYAKLNFNVGPGGQALIPTEIDYDQDFGPSDHELWDAEYAANIKAAEWLSTRTAGDKNSDKPDLTGYALPYDFIEEFERMEPAERQFTLDELAERPDLWNEEEVMLL
jgi:proteasome lid subunit RPN8/RPN11